MNRTPANSIAGRPEGGQPRTSAVQAIRVLIADDHAVLRTSLRYMLEAQGGIEVLGEAANTMLFQADTSHLHAVQRNLKASGAAWAELQMSQHNDINEPVSLDVTELSDRPASLTVQRESSPDANTIRIDTEAQKGRRTLADSFVLPISEN